MQVIEQLGEARFRRSDFSARIYHMAPPRSRERADEISGRVLHGVAVAGTICREGDLSCCTRGLSPVQTGWQDAYVYWMIGTWEPSAASTMLRCIRSVPACTRGTLEIFAIRAMPSLNRQTQP